MLKLSVLDQSVIAKGRPQDASIRDTLLLAEHCEKLGFERFWVSEHHSLPSIAGTAPEVLLAAIAARTSRIRIGSAGVMLPHYSSLKVAEQFRVLDALAPGRVDLGLGRAPGSDGRTSQLLNPDRYASERFPQQVMELQAWVTGQTMPAGHPGQGVWALPIGQTAPSLWILGSSNYGAQLAAHLGLPYAFAYFFSDGVGVEEALALYRSQFRPSEYLDKPYATICVSALLADTEEEANNMVSYLNSKLITYIFSLFKFKQHINAQNFDFIPCIPMNIKWNDQELFSYFNLNKEEIDYIINL
jgi:luciferase family oxidoreductase group 1